MCRYVLVLTYKSHVSKLFIPVDECTLDNENVTVDVNSSCSTCVCKVCNITLTKKANGIFISYFKCTSYIIVLLEWRMDLR